MSKSLPTILILLSLLLAPRAARAQTTWHVDDDCAPPGVGTEDQPFCTIQDGVNASSDGDTVVVAPGTYAGDGNRDIRLFGKRIVLTSLAGPDETIIDVQGGPDAVHTGFRLTDGENHDTVVEGLTIMNGYLVGDTGGAGIDGGGGGAAIFIKNGSPTIRNCMMRDNVADLSGIPWVYDGRGGAILIEGGSSTVIENCILMDNTGNFGGGIYVHEDCFVTLRNCVVANNVATNRGGGIHNRTYGGALFIENTTVWGNIAALLSGGLHSENSDTYLSNSIFYENSAGLLGQQMFVVAPAVMSFEYSNLEGGPGDIDDCCGSWTLIWGLDNIDAVPLFADPDNGDFRFLHGSPCIDAGNNLAVPEGVTTDLDGDPRFLDDPTVPDTGNPDPDAPKLPIVDMGPYEYDPDDCNNNGIPDADDLADGTSIDCDGENGNGIPDDCEADCNENDQADSCDIALGVSEDCTGNAIPDECEADCNENGQADTCDLDEGVSEDCTGNGIPDECEPDCNDNGVADSCDIADETSTDCNDNGTPDECEPQADCNGNGQLDSCDIADGTSVDCFGGIAGGDGVPDECCPGDVGLDEDNVGRFDVAGLLATWGACPDSCIEGVPNCACPADFDRNCTVNAFDLAFLLGHWGPCP